MNKSPYVMVSASKLIEYEKAIGDIGGSVNDPDLFKTIEKACCRKQAFLFEVQEGMVVVRPVGESGLLLWVAYTRDKADLAGYQFELERMARFINATYIELWSIRKGLYRILPKFGYTPRFEKYKETPITVWKKTL